MSDVRLYTRRDLVRMATIGIAGTAIAPALEGAGGVVSPRSRNLVPPRWFTMGGARKLTARDYVQDGLIGQFDAIENIGYGVSDITSTRWYDTLHPECYINLGDTDVVGDDYVLISGNRHIGLVNNRNWLSICLGNYDDRTVAIGDMTCEMCFGFAPFDPPVKGGCLLRLDYVEFIGVYDRWSKKNFQLTMYGLDEYNLDVVDKKSIVVLRDNVGQTLDVSASFVIDEDRFLTLYRDGLTKDGVASRCDKTVLTLSTYPSVIGSVGRQCKHRSIRLYNRQLSQDEVAHNYAVDKARFNLA